MIIKRPEGYFVLSDCRMKVLGGPFRRREDAERLFKVVATTHGAQPRLRKLVRSIERLDSEEDGRTLH